MTEAEWLGETNLRSMLKHLERTASDRKFRLWAVAYCRHIWDQMLDERSRNAVEVAEQFADSHTSRQELSKAVRAAYGVPISPTSGYSRFCAWNTARLAIRQRVRLITNAPFASVQRDLLWDIFGNPFRSVSFDPQWRTDTVLTLAHQMYESRDFSAMPILADALQDAGCDSTDILSHCRGNGPHVRGCWVVDLVLDKE